MSVISSAPLHRIAEPRSWRSTAPRALVRASAFTALALMGALRWAALTTPASTGRALGLVGIALAIAVLGPSVAARSRLLAAFVLLVALLASLAVCGLPLPWVRHVRIARSVHAFGLGLSALPDVFVPYRGASPWVRMTILSGAAVLLLDAAAMLAFGGARRVLASGTTRPGWRAAAGPASGDLRRAVATLPLIALVAVPLTLLPARLPYVQGALLFGLLAAAVWGERVPAGRRGPAAMLCGVAVLAAMVFAPGLRGGGPWINYRALSGALATSGSDAFDWNQTYGPLRWPQDDREVLEVKARYADYWKAVNLEYFDGIGWRIGSPPDATLAQVTPAVRRRFTQTITVDVENMTTPEVIGAGETDEPLRATRILGHGASPGTWVAATPLTAGDSYTAQVYSPRPTARELAHAGTAYPRNVADDDLGMGVVTALGTRAAVDFPAFRPHAGAGPITSLDGGPFLGESVYAPVYELARRLRDGAATPYAFVRRVRAFLGHGFTYDQHPAARAYPLADFLLVEQRGYCQQFAGAMALLLRMGGVPARVAAGFTQGQYDPTLHRWLVSDLNAHAWVEVYFPRYGWVRFDPTPAADPALHATKLGSLLPATPGSNGGGVGATAPKTAVAHGLGTPGGPAAGHSTARHGRRAGGGVSRLAWLLALVLIAAAGTVGVAAALAWRRRGAEAPPADAIEARVRELERAFARMGRPLDARTTLGALERRLRDVPEAAAYVAALTRARYGGEASAHTQGRRALRTYLRTGLGLGGALRALWALPPRPDHRFGSASGGPKLHG